MNRSRGLTPEPEDPRDEPTPGVPGPPPSPDTSSDTSGAASGRAPAEVARTGGARVPGTPPRPSGPPAGHRRGRRGAEPGSLDRPYSALNLRLLLASYGFVAFTALAVLAFTMRLWPLFHLNCALAAVALTNAVVVAVRRHRRGGHHSLFE